MNGENFNRNLSRFTDTGQWRLIVTLEASGITAILKHIGDPSEKPIKLFAKEWMEDENLLEKVEEAIYNNPGVLEDFATNIIIQSPKSLWIPADKTSEEDEYDDKLFTTVYPADREDIFADFGDEQVCLYTLTPGLNSFLRRTLPGCRVSSHLSLLKRIFEKAEVKKVASRSNEAPVKSIYVSVRKREADIFAFENGKFLSGATHEWREPSDLTYKLMLVAQTYKLNPSETDLYITGNENDCDSLAAAAGEFFGATFYLRQSPIVTEFNIPLIAALDAGEPLYLVRKSL